MEHRLSLTRIEQVTQVIAPLFLNTPQYCAEPLEAILGCRLLVKVETLAPIRSSKGRGTSFSMAALPPTTTTVVLRECQQLWPGHRLRRTGARYPGNHLREPVCQCTQA